jgi:hypothetical protein
MATQAQGSGGEDHGQVQRPAAPRRASSPAPARGPATRCRRGGALRPHAAGWAPGSARLHQLLAVMARRGELTLSETAGRGHRGRLARDEESPPREHVVAGCRHEPARRRGARLDQIKAPFRADRGDRIISRDAPRSNVGVIWEHVPAEADHLRARLRARQSASRWMWRAASAHPVTTPRRYAACARARDRRWR